MKRVLSIVISFMMMATIVGFPVGSFAEENAIEDGSAAVSTDASVNVENISEQKDSKVTKQENVSEEEGIEKGEPDKEGESEPFGSVTDITVEEETPNAPTPAEELPDTDTVTESVTPEADDETDKSDKTVSLEALSAGQVNPLYEGILDESDITIPTAGDSVAKSASARSITYRKTIDAVATDLRNQMEARKGTITLYYQTDSYDGTSQVLYDIFNAAMVHTGTPTEGDYLQWHWQNWGATITGKKSSGVYYLTLIYKVKYYTTAAQETAVNTKVKDIIAYLDLNSGKSPYVKVRAIYDYICSNVSYDNANLNNSAYTLKHSAYAAFINKKAVCQGYALMFYRLALEAGIDTRIIAGDYNTRYTGPNDAWDNHGWNIVKIDGKYYNIDSTWDADETPYEHEWFVMGKGGTFDKEHQRWPEYKTTAFNASYPMASSDYVGPIPTANISSWKAHLPYTRVSEDGTEKRPKVIIPGLVENTDFTVEYSGSKGELKSAGNTVTVTIKGIGNYTGTITKSFYIGKGVAVHASATSLSQTSYIYDGTVKKPTVKVGTLKPGTDYTVSYSNNTNAGTATVTVTGIGEYAGSFTKTFTIKPASISSMTLKVAAYTYNGKRKTPAATVKSGTKTLTNGTHYTIAYSKNLYPGTARATVTGKGNYTGSLYKSFTIKAPSVATPKTIKANLYGYDDFKASWSKVSVKGATVKYKVQYQQYKKSWKTLKKGTTSTSAKKANLSDGKKYRFKVMPYVTVNGKTYKGKTKTSSYVYTLKKISKPKVKKSSKTKIKISWINISGETGYQIARSTKKSKGYKVIKTIKSTKAKSTAIKAKKKANYYYKVRAYKTVSGKKIYGPWSSPRKYKLK